MPNGQRFASFFTLDVKLYRNSASFSWLRAWKARASRPARYLSPERHKSRQIFNAVLTTCPLQIFGQFAGFQDGAKGGHPISSIEAVPGISLRCPRIFPSGRNQHGTEMFRYFRVEKRFSLRQLGTICARRTNRSEPGIKDCATVCVSGSIGQPRGTKERI